MEQEAEYRITAIPPSRRIQFFQGEREVLCIEEDGLLRLGEGVTVDEAAEAFVAAVNEVSGWRWPRES